MDGSVPAMTGIADEHYVAITTFTRDGRRKSTPVWIADLGDGTLGFTTEADSWKAKRIGNTPAVELVPSDRKGVTEAGAPVTHGTAVVVTDAEAERVEAAIQRKYGWQKRLIDVIHTVTRLVRRTATEQGAVIVTPAAD